MRACAPAVYGPSPCCARSRYECARFARQACLYCPCSCFLPSCKPCAPQDGWGPIRGARSGVWGPTRTPYEKLPKWGSGGCEYHPPVNENSAVCRIARRIFGEIFGVLRTGSYICLAVNIILIVLTPPVLHNL